MKLLEISFILQLNLRKPSLSEAISQCRAAASSRLRFTPISQSQFYRLFYLFSNINFDLAPSEADAAYITTFIMCFSSLIYLSVPGEWADPTRTALVLPESPGMGHPGRACGGEQGQVLGCLPRWQWLLGQP